jgi:hypothetical protein
LPLAIASPDFFDFSRRRKPTDKATIESLDNVSRFDKMIAEIRTSAFEAGGL